MKKILTLLVSFLLLFTLVGCGNKKEDVQTKEEVKEETKTLIDVPSGFIKGLIEPEFEKFNSRADENGLGGTMIVKYGKIKTVTEVEANGGKIFAGTFEDNDGHQWYAMYGVANLGDKIDSYENIIDHDVCVKAQYIGYSGVYEMPAFVSDNIFDRTNGNMIANSGYKAMYGDDEVWADQNAPEEEKEEPIINQPVEEPKEEVSDNNAIRPEVKEAIDSFEAFIDEYCEISKKYLSSSGTDLGIIADYTKFLSKYSDASKKMEDMEDDLNDAELKYYTEVMLRCDQKLLEVAQ